MSAMVVTDYLTDFLQMNECTVSWSPEKSPIERNDKVNAINDEPRAISDSKNAMSYQTGNRAAE